MVMVNQTSAGLDDDQEEGARAAYARSVGARLRVVRKQMRLSLQAVEAMSDQEFKASVLGAYERGERAISVGSPWAAVNVVPPAVYVDVGSKCTVPTSARGVCVISVGASRIHSAEDWDDE